MRQDGGRPLSSSSSSSKVIVHLAATLRQHAGGEGTIELDVSGEPVTVRAVLDALDAQHPSVGRRLRDEAGAVRRHVNVFVGQDNQRDLDGVDTVVPDGAEVSVMPAVSGGGG